MTNHNEFNIERVNFWDTLWSKHGNKLGFSRYYHTRLLEIYKTIIPENSSVLEIGCGNGKLIGNLDCGQKTGVDFSKQALTLAKNNFPDCKFIEANILELELVEKFDYIILSDVVGDLWDVQIVFSKLKQFCHSRTRIVINFYSKLWEGPLRFLAGLHLKKPTLEQNWLTRNDIEGLQYLADFETIKLWQEILLPVKIPLLNGLINKFLVKIAVIKHLALTNFIIARPCPDKTTNRKVEQVSVIVAARNEAGHIKEIIERVPKMGTGTELIFVEGNSTDNTYDVIESELLKYPNKDIKLFKQPGKGKGDAVRKGFSEASGNILMILDADLSVMPEKLHLFYEALCLNKGEFINGVRLVYPMEKHAMRFFNLLANKSFSAIFTYLLGQKIRDTLCGTKCLWKEDYEQIANYRSYFGDFDPFGDFDLIFGATKLNLKIQDLPIRYQERTYGTTNISRWKHGWILFKMVLFAARKIKFL